MEHGLDPGLFWAQTPRSYSAIMEGRNKASKRDHEMALFTAWHGEAFARQKTLKPLSHWMKKLNGKKTDAQDGDDIVAVFEAHAARGAKIKIRKIEG